MFRLTNEETRFHLVARVIPHGWDLGVQGGGGKNARAQFFLVPAPWGLWEGPKGQISLNLNYKVNFKDFYVSPGSYPRVWDFGVLGVRNLIF